jgi:hypothetical protein
MLVIFGPTLPQLAQVPYDVTGAISSNSASAQNFNSTSTNGQLPLHPYNRRACTKHGYQNWTRRPIAAYGTRNSDLGGPLRGLLHLPTEPHRVPPTQLKDVGSLAFRFDFS